MNALEREIAGLPVDTPICTFYIGGGTPTILPAVMLEELLRTIQRHLKFTEDCEATIEANPGTVDKEKFRSMRGAGLNRVSIGVQSFNEDQLKFLGRRHSSADAVKALKEARDAGFENIGIDLIYGIPGQDMDDWLHALELAVRLRPQHISTYELTIEGGTPLSEMLRAGSLSKPLPDEETIVMMYDRTIDYLSSAGYHHYEISNFALPSYECRHNINYWDRGDYLGAGAGAHSLIRGRRIRNHASIDRYIDAVQRGEVPIEKSETLSAGQALSEALFLGMRKTEGVCVERIARRYGINILNRYGKEIEEMKKADLIDISISECSYETCIKLTRKGLRLSNEVFKTFI